MKRRTLFTWIVVLGVLALAWLFTGGIAIQDARDFGGQGPIKLAEGLEGSICLGPTTLESGLPFLFHYWRGRAPFDLGIRISDQGKEYAAVEFSAIVIAYADGTTLRPQTPWRRRLRPETLTVNSKSGVVRVEHNCLDEDMPSMVTKHMDVAITLTGHFIKQDGTIVPFSVSKTFAARSDFIVRTYWNYLAGC